MATSNAEISRGNEIQIRRADIFGIRQDLYSGLADLGELTVHSGKVFSCKIRNEGGPNLDIKFDSDDCKIFVLDKNGNGDYSLPHLSSTKDVKVVTQQGDGEDSKTVLVFPIRDSKSVIVVGKDFVTVK